MGVPEELVIVDRQKAANMKLTVSQIANTLQTVLSGTPAGYYHDSGDQFRILVQVKDAEKMALSEILDLTLTNTDGQPVVLRNVVQVTPRTGPVLIERKDQERIVLVSANISGRDMGSFWTTSAKNFSRFLCRGILQSFSPETTRNNRKRLMNCC